MKEKNTLPSKGKSIFYLMLSLIATLFVSSFIYFLVLHPSLDNKAVRISINIGWTCFCLYAFKRLTQRYTFWWHALDENPNKSQNNKPMPIIVNLDVMMAKRKISLGDLAEKIDLTPANLSILKTGKAKAIRFSTLEAICRELDCQPGDILEYREEDE